MTKRELIEQVARKAHLTKRAAMEAVEVFLDEVGRVLSKGEKVVLSGFGTFRVGKGELVGFIGPNGAGKTTTLKILSGLLFPTAGVTQVLGFDPWERRTDFLKKISLVMGQKNQLWWDLPAIDTFELNRAI